jgi:hypothetical protein
VSQEDIGPAEFENSTNIFCEKNLSSLNRNSILAFKKKFAKIEINPSFILFRTVVAKYYEISVHHYFSCIQPPFSAY